MPRVDTRGEDDTLDGAWMARLFPDRSAAKHAEWLHMLHSSGCATSHDLTQLNAQSWRELGTRTAPAPFCALAAA